MTGNHIIRKGETGEPTTNPTLRALTERMREDGYLGGGQYDSQHYQISRK